MVLYFILGLISIAVSIISWSFGAEWWVGTMFIVLGIGAFAIAIYKLDEDTMLISNFINGKREKSRAEKADKIVNSKYRTSSMNMVEMFNKAYDERKEQGADYIGKKGLRYILPAYREIISNLHIYQKEIGKEITEEEARDFVFAEFQINLAFVFGCDERGITSVEYSLYCDFCRKLGEKPMTMAKFNSYPSELMNKEDGRYFNARAWRGGIEDKKYRDMVMGFCYLAMLDETVHENEYYVIRAFFHADIDRFPKTWEQFKMEY
ncbi:MAG: hypothetical protein J6B29_04960 [Clostridia bacterium]|nr:hypothetical protein [Clostridia bacterium]